MTDLPENSLKKYEPLCEELHNLLLEENSQLKKQTTQLERTFLERKRTLLDEFDEFIAVLKQTSQAEHSQRPAVQRMQNRLTKILYLNRENEQLCLKADQPTMNKTPLRVDASAKNVSRRYQSN